MLDESSDSECNLEEIREEFAKVDYILSGKFDSPVDVRVL